MGGPAPASYVEIYFPRSELTLSMLEGELPSVARSIISARQARKLLSELNHWQGEVKAQWKARANAHQAAIERGDPFEYAKVFKGLSRLEANGTLRAQDRAHLNQTQELLTEELAWSLGKTPEQARDLLARASAS